MNSPDQLFQSLDKQLEELKAYIEKESQKLRALQAVIDKHKAKE